MMRFVLVSWGNLHRSPRSLFLIQSLINRGHHVKLIFVVASEDCKQEFLCSDIASLVDVYFVETICHNKIYLVEASSHAKKCFSGILKKNVRRIAKIILTKNTVSLLSWIRYKNLAAGIAKDPGLVDFASKSDVVYACEFHHSSELAFQLSQLLNIHFIYDLKEHYESQFHHPWWLVCYIRLREQVYFSNSLLMPTVSQGFLDLYAKVHPQHQDKFVLLENTLPSGRDKGNIALVSDKSSIKIIASIGGLTADRGMIEWLTIWNALGSTSARLFVRVGQLTDMEKSDLINAASQTYQKTWDFIGSVNTESILTSNDDFDIGLIPYLPNKNNHIFCSPGKFGQYITSGLAVITSNTKNIGDKVLNHQLGMVYDPYNVDKSVVLLREFLSNYKLINDSKANAVNYYQNHYYWEKQADPYLDRLESLVSIE